MTFTSEGDPGSCPSHFGPQDTSVAPCGLCPCLKQASPGHRPLSHRLGAFWTGGDLITTAQEGAPGVHRSVSLPWELAGPVGRGPGLATTVEGPPSPERRGCLHRPAVRPPALGCDGPPFLHRLCLHPAERGHELAYVTGERTHPRVTGQQVAAQVEVAAPTPRCARPQMERLPGTSFPGPSYPRLQTTPVHGLSGVLRVGAAKGRARCCGRRAPETRTGLLSPLPSPTSHNLGSPPPQGLLLTAGQAGLPQTPTPPTLSAPLSTAQKPGPGLGWGRPPSRTPGPAERGRFTVKFGKSAQSPPCYRLPGFGWTRSI